MPNPYSRKSLAELIADGHDTGSAAHLFNRSVKFIQKEQATPEYQQSLQNALRNRTEIEKRREVSTAKTEAANAPRATLTGIVERDIDAIDRVRKRIYYYDVGNPPPEQFFTRYYLSETELINNEPLTAAEIPNHAADVSFDPPIPSQEPGTHFTSFSFRHIREGNLIVLFGAE